jgi:hypothetical protein
LNAPIEANETQETKVFWFFFSKKNIFLSLLHIWLTGYDLSRTLSGYGLTTVLET